MLLLVQIMQKSYFEEDNFTLYLGNSLKLLKKFPPEHFDMIFADPPYNLSNGGFTVHAGKRVSVHKGDWDKSKGLEKDLKFHADWIKLCKRILKPNGTIWISGTYHSIYRCGYALEANGYHVLNDITWYKPNAAPNLSGRYFAASHETLIWARKDKNAKHTFNYEYMREHNWPKSDVIKNSGKQMRSVWVIPDDVWGITTPKPAEKKFGKHPTQKPLALLERVILASTKEGDLILDPFTGSSTTGIAAILLNRKFVGIDTEKAYLEVSKKRFEEAKLKKGQTNINF